ncbi:hypothetical protein [Candidatus Methanocrinis natronophilus]|uniref:Uncharacterized protein n=1 Tax=Candidatus Methanocrinis natronophilus TaxID=3033396 RepID=A0ABT5X4K0_9EURY|nr:hypothetical protein [Candidatus Methanocrinis natronophilus]MDF0589611.1 hypothetical protein [Candidatus Methanocrinis natronophilus]
MRSRSTYRGRQRRSRGPIVGEEGYQVFDPPYAGVGLTPGEEG